MLTLASADTLAGSADAATDVTYTIFGDALTTSDAYQVLAQGQLANSAATIYTVPGSTQALISTITFSNQSAGARTVTLYRGGTAAANALVSFIIPANGSANFNGENLDVYNASGNITIAIPLATATPLPIALAGVVGGSGLASDGSHAHATNEQSAHMTTTQTVSGTAVAGTAITVLNISLPLASTAYNFESKILATNSATPATAVGVGVTLPAGATMTASIIGGTNATAIRNTYFTAGGTCQASFATTSGFTDPIIIKGIVSMSTATGSMQVIANCVSSISSNATTATINAGSYLVATPVN